MKKYVRALVVGAGAVIAFGMITACSSGTKQEAPATSVAAAMPQSATYIAEAPEKDGSTMTMAITVEGDKVVAYGTNGEAYFFGTQKDGQMELMSMYGDNLKASFDGTDVTGEMTMNETNVAPMKFAASSVAAPAGLYTATHGNARACWVVGPDHTMVGVMDNNAPGDHKVTDAIAAKDQAFKDKVHQMRLDRQLQQAAPMNMSTRQMDMDGTMVTVVRLTGDMSF
jgi:hypothetical protein